MKNSAWRAYAGRVPTGMKDFLAVPLPGRPFSNEAPQGAVVYENVGSGDVRVNSGVLKPGQAIWVCYWCLTSNAIGLQCCEYCGMVRT